MQPVVMIAFGEYEDIEVEAPILKQIDADIIYTRTLRTAESQEIARSADAIGIATDPVTREIIDTLEQCKIISRFGTGLDNIDILAATEHGIWVTNVPDAFVEEVSTHTMSMLLACNRHLYPLFSATRTGIWESKILPIRRLRGLTLGLVGFGLIARATAQKARAMGLEVIAYDPHVDPEQFTSSDVEAVEFAELLKRSDYVSLHAPATDSTRKMIDEEALVLMRPNAYLINTSRGALIDEAALLKAINRGEILGAALDVRDPEPPRSDDPLMAHERILLTPHIAWCSQEAGHDLRVRAAQAIVDVLSGNRPLNPANNPLK